MNRFFLLTAVLLYAGTCIGQQDITIRVNDADSKTSLPSATISIPSIKKTVVTDSSGIGRISNLSNGQYRILISYAGYEEMTRTVRIPFTDSVLVIELEASAEEEVIVQSTRTSRNIRNVPTRVETIELEEIDEKSNMRPGNVSMLLHESTGIQVQQTSATSGNASIRIQGLDGRYTQLLKDGFANFGNFSSGLSVLEIPPLDLKQVEIIKGPVSTLYGGGAIAGVVNFISKTPGNKPEYNLVLNQSNIGQTNLGYFSMARGKKTGYSFLGLVSNQNLYDVDKDDFTEVPKLFEFTLNPRLFIYSDENGMLVIGNSFTKSDREGGDVQVIRNKADNFHRYFEENNTIRNISTLEWVKKRGENDQFVLKQSFSIFDRHIRIPDYHFHGIGYNSYTDFSWLINKKKHSLVAGGNALYDDFNEKEISAGDRDSRNITAGAFLQDTWDASDKVKLESGLRFDWAQYSNDLFKKSEFFVLPRVSLLVKYNDKLSSRIGAGMGYKLPTLFTERTETIQYSTVQQLNNVKSERSYGGTADLNYKTRLGSIDIAFNQLFFYSWIDRPLVLEELGVNGFRFVNATEPVQTTGFETNAKFIYRHNLKLFLGYTFTDARAKYLAGNQFLPLVPKHKFNSALIYEKHDFIKLGLEAYYTSPQFLYDGFRTDDYWEVGFMAEKLFKHFSLYINFENFTDTRQSRFKRVANGAHEHPEFDDIWTHTEGFVVNGGIKIKL
jgi:outer membrane receptor for ferrienterochelin and colicins